MKESILFLEPHFEEKIWGNDFFLRHKFNVSSSKVGEAFIVSALKDKSSIIRNKNITLFDFFYDEKNKYFFNYYEGKYPLLVKIISTSDDLSVQVHPNDIYALKKHNSLGKNECWYILECEKNASIVYGHNAQNKSEIEQFIKSNDWNFLNHIPIKKNDFIYVPSGKVHAIKKNTLIFELQQSSDITYRLYDYDRLDNNKKRDLHIEDALNTITVPDISNELMENDYNNPQLISNSFFTLIKIKITGFKNIFIPIASWLQISIISGKGFVNNFAIKKYDSFIVAHKTKINFIGFMDILISYIC